MREKLPFVVGNRFRVALAYFRVPPVVVLLKEAPKLGEVPYEVEAESFALNTSHEPPPPPRTLCRRVSDVRKTP